MLAIAASAYENGQTAAKLFFVVLGAAVVYRLLPAVFVQAAEECFRRPSA
jgi:hypothetical protein